VPNSRHVGRRAEKNVGGHKYDYAYDLAGNMVMEYDVTNGWWERGEISVSGRHLATYANDTTYFDHQDWLGSERARTDMSGNVFESWTDNPYGDGLTCTGSCAYDVSGLPHPYRAAFAR
jgi:hypothetical protein